LDLTWPELLLFWSEHEQDLKLGAGVPENEQYLVAGISGEAGIVGRVERLSPSCELSWRTGEYFHNGACPRLIAVDSNCRQVRSKAPSSSSIVADTWEM
jgi:hypothetical protein